ncbi:uncharacterized protein LOC128671817 isoform X2 [Plodia interpunctella]|uniref:uncharacterized protein LOC128671817 isoform X2 n=1 Tax=Plodia interpunctella TaxID=58824 RepID=UPI0023686A9B|nr:uncharacterized protein LOC128671817 isoform X2 [Plodia interpunctella]
MKSTFVVFLVVVVASSAYGKAFRHKRQSDNNEDGLDDRGSSNAECLRNCPVTPEYNPVCGTDNVTYTNPGRLGCAQACGVSVSLLRSSPCPTSTPAPSS